MVGQRVLFPEYEDFLERMKKIGGPYAWATQNRTFPFNSSESKHPKERTLSEINESVMNSARVKSTIILEAHARGCSQNLVRKEAEEILNKLAHKFGMGHVRTLGYSVTKVFEKIYDGIYVNSDAMQKVREKCKDTPVVFMPTHRTYLDFLLLSIFCYDNNIHLPAIAAGEDFMASPLMGYILRRSGAFFMRRSFGKDQLYWAVFSEYVQSHVVNSDRPVEFFVEGTRSRVGKSLHPKFGLLQIVLEPFLRGHVYDMTIVPVSMNYDKILEEKLYAYELLGFPKPKESTSGLLKARDILNENYGKCFITFGEPISARKYFGTTLQRPSFVCQPDSQFVLDPAARDAIRRFGHFVVRKNNENSVITVWPLACQVMLQMLDTNDHHVFQFNQLVSDVESLISLLHRLRIIVDVQKTVDEDLRYYIKVHDDLFEPLSIEDNFQLKLKDLPVEKEGSVPKEIMERSVSRLILTTYANVMMSSVIEMGYISTIAKSLKQNNLKSLKDEFLFLANALRREFVVIPEEEDQIFTDALKNLKRAGIVSLTETEIIVKDQNVTDLLSSMTVPYITQITLICSTLLDIQQEKLTVNNIISEAQKNFVRHYQSNQSVRLSYLSTEPIKNTVSTLQEMKIVTRTGSNYSIDVLELRKLLLGLERFTTLSTNVAQLTARL